jgi:hypothetical protein
LRFVFWLRIRGVRKDAKGWGWGEYKEGGYFVQNVDYFARCLALVRLGSWHFWGWLRMGAVGGGGLVEWRLRAVDDGIDSCT